MPRAPSSSLAKRRLDGPGVTPVAKCTQPFYLRVFDRRVDTKDGYWRFLFNLITIDAYDDGISSFYGSLITIGRFLDFALHITRLNCPQHAAHRINLFQVLFGSLLNLVSELFDCVRAGQRIDSVSDT